MDAFCRASLTIGLPRRLVWKLIIDPSTRHLWQPHAISANLKSGHAGEKDSKITLEIKKGEEAIEITERVIRSRTQDSFVSIQSWPKHQVHNKYIFSAMPDDSTQLTLQKRYKSPGRLDFWGKASVQQQLEMSATEELISLKNFSAKLHNHMADRTTYARAVSK